MIKYIRLDMDGVIADFAKFFNENAPLTLEEAKNIPKDEFKAIKKKLIEEEDMFLRLEKMPDADKLIEHLIAIESDHGTLLTTLTAVGDYSSEISIEQKRAWMQKHYPNMLFNSCIKSKDKASYACKHTLLIDDREKSTIPFIEAGGNIILHTSANETIRRLGAFTYSDYLEGKMKKLPS